MTTAGAATPKTERNLWSAIADEALANLRYHAFAMKAMEEGYPEVAQVFQEISGAEVIHGISHMRVAGLVKPSLDNLRDVIEAEAREAATLYPRMVREAVDEGRTDAAESFSLAMEREGRHIEAFTQALEGLQAKLAGRGETALEGTAAAAPAAGVAATPPAPFEIPPAVTAVEQVRRERWRVEAASRIREVVFGAQDGLLSTVALVTSVAVTGAHISVVLVAGMASALAGMISMATGSYLGSKAASDVHKAEIEKERRELEMNPAEEFEEMVVIYQMEGMTRARAHQMAEHIASDPDLMLRTMVEKELGLGADITADPLKDGLAMGAAFILAALLPIVPYMALDRDLAVPFSVAAALTGLFGLGVWKGTLVKRSPILQGLEILGIGTAAAAIAFLLGSGIPRLFNV